MGIAGTADNASFRYNLLVGNNSSNCPSTNAINSDCSPNGSSTSTAVTGISLANSFVGKISSDDTQNAADSNGSALSNGTLSSATLAARNRRVSTLHSTSSSAVASHSLAVRELM